jgi:peptide chain release factor subunit 3
MSDGPPPPPGAPPAGDKKLTAAAPAFNPNAFAFKPRNLPSGAGGGAPPPPPGAPPAGGAPQFFERAAPAADAPKKKELVIGGAPKKKEFVIGGPAPKKELVIGDGPPKKKEFVIGGPAPAKDDPQSADQSAPKAAPEKAAPEKEMQKLSVTEKANDAPTEAKPEPEPEIEVPVEEDDASYDAREHLNLVFIGHVDAGKSTIGGQILFQAGMVDDRTIEKYEKDAKEKNRESWYMAYIMDTSEEERAKGKTVEVGRAHFETEKKRYTVLDAPGHKNYVPNMIAGAAQADVGVLVIAARKGEFETGFERGGQTREHAQLAKTLGVTKLIVLVNKMDDPTVKWDKGRWDEINVKISPFLKSCGYNPKDVQFVPVSGLYGTNMKTVVDKETCPWYEGESFFETLDNLDPLERNPDAPFRLPVLDKHKDMGTIVMGKTEAGTVRRGDKLVVMPNNVKVQVAALFRDDVECSKIAPGENVRMRLTGIEEDQLQSGFVLCAPSAPVHVTQEIECQLAILELLEHKTLFTAGYKAVIHIHAVTEECEVVKVVHEIDGKTRKPKEKKKGQAVFLKSGSLAVVRIKTSGIICCEKYADVASLGRFTLRDEGKTIAIGKVLKLKPYDGINQQ